MHKRTGESKCIVLYIVQLSAIYYHQKKMFKPINLLCDLIMSKNIQYKTKFYIHRYIEELFALDLCV